MKPQLPLTIAGCVFLACTVSPPSVGSSILAQQSYSQPKSHSNPKQEVDNSRGKGTVQGEKERNDFLVEASRTSHEELVFRVTQRDNWMKIQLLAQITLLALALGVEFGGTKVGTKRTAGLRTLALALAMPVSVTLAAQYFDEDLLVNCLSHYRHDLTGLEAALSGGAAPIELFEASKWRKEYWDRAFSTRTVGQAVAFAVIPLVLTVGMYFRKWRLCRTWWGESPLLARGAHAMLLLVYALGMVWVSCLVCRAASLRRADQASPSVPGPKIAPVQKLGGRRESQRATHLLDSAHAASRSVSESTILGTTENMPVGSTMTRQRRPPRASASSTTFASHNACESTWVKSQLAAYNVELTPSKTFSTRHAAGRTLSY